MNTIHTDKKEPGPGDCPAFGDVREIDHAQRASDGYSGARALRRTVFGPGGAFPYNNLVVGPDGVLYGTTYNWLPEGTRVPSPRASPKRLEKYEKALQIYKDSSAIREDKDQRPFYYEEYGDARTGH
jgi:hypothetical protein